MKGVIFNLVEEVITSQFGADTWDDLLEAAAIEGAYTSLGNYEDAELVALVQAAAASFELSPDDVLRFVGRHGFAGLAGRYPAFVAAHTSSRSVLADLNGVIHPQVLTLYPGASVPEFDFSETGSRIELVYRSHRSLCHLGEGLAEGAVIHFGESAVINQTRCRLRGDDECRIVVDYGTDA